MASDAINTRFKVLIFPWLATGHITPYLELAKILSRNDFHTYFCSTSVNLSSIQNTFKNNSWDYPIEFIELSLPHLSDFPPQFHTTKDLPRHLMPTLLETLKKTQPNFAQILSNLKPDLLISDGFVSWAGKLASSMNIPSVHLNTVGAATLSYNFHHSIKLSQDISCMYPFSEIYLNGVEMKKLFAFIESKAEDIAFSCFKLSTNIVLINNCRETEGKYLDYLSSLTGKKIVSLGPLVQEVKTLESHRHIIGQWLDNKVQPTVVYVSFGSEYFWSKEEMEEIASGLELSNAKFLWAVRISKGNTIKEALPEGFLEKVKNQGMVVEGWAPQAMILQHPSIGGFVSHCGWNSVSESLYYDVVVIAIPIQYDQPLNTKLMEGLGVGIEVPRDEHRKLERVNIANVIKKVVIEKDGQVLRKKARELSVKVKAEKEVNINGVVQELRKVCREGKLKQ